MLRKLRLKQKNDFLIKKKCNYMEQGSTKNGLALLKTNRVSKYMLSVQKKNYAIHNINVKARVKNIPSNLKPPKY